MKKFLFIFFVTVLTVSLNALGTLRVESIKELPTEHMNLEVRDADGKFAPVLIVKTELKGLGFQNVSRPTIHAVEYMTGDHHYKFYMNDNQRVVKITHSEYEPLELRLLADFGTDVKAQRVYELELDFDKEVVQIPVVIICNQSGAEIFVNGDSVGKTQNKILTLNVGSGLRTIRIEKDGFASQEKQKEISMTNNSFNFALVPAMPAVVKINTTPEGATVTIDTNVKLGVTPLETFYDAGKFPIRIEKENYEPIIEQITIIEPETKKHFNLVELRASLTVKTHPNATVIFNGKSFIGGMDKQILLPQIISFRIEQEFCEKIEETYTLKNKENKVFELYPENIAATFTIKTHPNATVIFNGKNFKGGVVDYKISPQVLQITLEMPKAETITRIVTLKPKATETLEIFPEVQTGIIQVMTIPTNAKIELKGDGGEHYTATGRKTFSDVPVGTYELIVTADGHKTHREIFRLNVDETVPKQITIVESSNVPENMVFVQSGTFQMGSNDGSKNEKPVHTVTMSVFLIGKYEVTQKEWEKIMGNNPSCFKGDSLPVENVSWYDAVEFCNKKSKEEGLTPCYSGRGKNIKCNSSENGYRLPTEAEWEYATRGSNLTNDSNLRNDYKYSGSNNIDDVAWYTKTTNDKGTKPVGTKQPNELGIYDMSGNVGEWCNDWYDKNYYSNIPKKNPKGPDSGSYRVLRGGSWRYNDKVCRVAVRYYDRPNFSFYSYGFRLARTPMK